MPVESIDRKELVRLLVQYYLFSVITVILGVIPLCVVISRPAVVGGGKALIMGLVALIFWLFPFLMIRQIVGAVNEKRKRRLFITELALSFILLADAIFFTIVACFHPEVPSRWDIAWLSIIPIAIWAFSVSMRLVSHHKRMQMSDPKILSSTTDTLKK